MVDWRERRDFYLQQGRLEDQKYEDMLAGRILRGLGFKQPQRLIYRVEQQVLGMTRGEQPLWPRAKEIFQRLLAQGPYVQLAYMFEMEAFMVKDHEEALERMSAVDWQSGKTRPVLFTRIKNTTQCFVYAFWQPEELTFIKPPFMVHPSEWHPRWLFTQQEAAHFVAQFGPYHLTCDDE